MRARTQEYGEKALPPNRNTVYLSYLDSVKYFRPEARDAAGERALRSLVYHEILLAYMAHARRLGMNALYIWSCPPLAVRRRTCLPPGSACAALPKTCSASPGRRAVASHACSIDRAHCPARARPLQLPLFRLACALHALIYALHQRLDDATLTVGCCRVRAQQRTADESR